MIITLADVRTYQSRYCSTGIEAFCKKYDIDFNKFLTEGVEEEVLLATGDSMARKIVEKKNGRW